jgi:hypothetical protein
MPDGDTTAVAPQASHVSNPPPVDDRPPPRRRGIGGVGTVLTFLGLASYGMARFMVDGYLAPFRLSYGDVGLEYTDLVANGAVFAVPVAFGIGLVYWRDDVRSWLRLPRGQLRILAVLVVVNVGLIFSLFLLAVGIDQLLRLLSPSIVAQDLLAQAITLFLLVFVGVVSAAFIHESSQFMSRMGRIRAAARQRRPGPQRESTSPAEQSERSGFDGLAIVLSVAMVIASCVAFHAIGSHFATAVQDGRRVHFSLLGVGMPGLRAEPVALYKPDNATPLSPEPAAFEPGEQPLPIALEPEECVLFLGSTDGTAIFYWPRGHAVLRFAVESISIKEQLGKAKCGQV